MRKFSSYGPVDPNLHYYAPRQSLIDRACEQLIGDNPIEGGQYITVWAPRQTGKTWVMQQVHQKIKANGQFEVAITTLQSAKSVRTPAGVLNVLVTNLRHWFDRDFPYIERWDELRTLFSQRCFSKPVILILDEFDALEETLLNQCANEFRSIYTERLNERPKSSGEKHYLLHGLALIGVRSVLGIENVTGSPFNVQRSLHIPNLTNDEVTGIFDWYQQESGQPIEPAVVARIYDQFRGQPGLTCWLGELLTETFNHQPDQPLTRPYFEEVYSAAVDALPNNTILNIISKAKQEPYKQLVLQLFQSEQKIRFKYDDPQINFLYLNGVVDVETASSGERYVMFANPFVQKRLFNYFAFELYRDMSRLYDPFEDLSDTITETSLNIPNLLKLYEHYLRENRSWLLRDVPRRKTDNRIYEAVYHFNLYMYLHKFMAQHEGQVYPEFPTGNGKIDLVIRYAGHTYGLEVKSFLNERQYRQALNQAAEYGHSLSLREIILALFVEYVDETNRQKYEKIYHHEELGITVQPIFVVIGDKER